ncbi:MAG: redox-sensing transcriptional repressor Rex [Clostridiales Family XIII bacterium]|jgi:redox-sensing transcriptional repressor|nr:redox-sensing transcriptional repressor Rex [Clostridiales Family XIII bacterium]
MNTLTKTNKAGEKISPAVIRRLPRYRSYLSDLQNSGIERISSDKLSGMMGYTASQIRQDLNNFGGFGQQGYGYNVALLNNEIAEILGLNKHYKMVIVGAGHLGTAITNYISVYRREFEIRAMFDIKRELIDTEISGIRVRDIADLEAVLKEEHIDIGVITTSRKSAQAIADVFVEGEIYGIWNFAAIDVSVPEHVALKVVHLSDSLHELVYYVNNRDNPSFQK